MPRRPKGPTPMTDMTTCGFHTGTEWLEQPALQWLNVALFIVASGFWIESMYADQAFSAEVYGAFALQFPAKAWAAAMMLGTTMTFIGLVRPIHRRKVVIGATILTVKFTLLAFSAIATGGELVVGMFSSVLFAPLFLKLAVEALQHDGE
jgi:hypothetical protein